MPVRYVASKDELIITSIEPITLPDDRDRIKKGDTVTHINDKPTFALELSLIHI